MKKKLKFIFIVLIIFIIGCQAEESPLHVEKAKLEDDALLTQLKSMSLEEKVGQLLMPTLLSDKEEPITTINEKVISMIKDYHIGGIILFQENIHTKVQTTKLIEQLQKSSDTPLMIGIDQEGGVVTRIPYIPSMPGNMALGSTESPELSKEVGYTIGSQLKSLGIQINFAPVIDVNNNPKNPVIGVRSFGDEPKLVAEFGKAFMEGQRQAGVISVAKHFPGHGDVEQDSHFVLPTSQKSLKDLRELEFIPFQSLINGGVPAIMTAHIMFDQIESETAISEKDGLPIKLPATLSKTFMTNILRNELGFEGVLFTDAMNMNAITDHFGHVEASIRAIEAGNDVVLMPIDVERVYNGIVNAVIEGRLTEERIDESVYRILQMKSSEIFQKQPNSEILYKDVLELERTVAEESITVIANEAIFPLSKDEKIAIVGTNKQLLDQLKAAILPYQWNINRVLLEEKINFTGKLTEAQISGVEEAKNVIVILDSSSYYADKLEEWEIKSIQNALSINTDSISLSLRTPYNYRLFKDIETAIFQYDTSTSSFNATGKILYGERSATGNLPIEIKIESGE